MIIELLFTIITGALSFLLGLLPDWELVDLSGLVATVETFFPDEAGTMLRWLNYYVPLREALLLGVTAAAFWVAMHVFRIVVDLLTKLHILGG